MESVPALSPGWMVPERYLLYLDILGFAEMAQSPRRVLDLYQIIDGLNVHRHPDFRALVFSDTLIVYNAVELQGGHDKQVCVMYLAEFAQDLLRRLIGRDYYFRAILTKGGFLHHRFDNLDAFFGQALIDSYRNEKDLTGCGLFLDERLLAENRIFPTRRHCERFHYVFLTPSIQYLSDYGDSGFPFSGEPLDSTDMTLQVYAELTFLADVYRKSMEHPTPNVRAKFQATWSFYQLQFPLVCNVLRESGFDFNSVADADWRAAKSHFDNELESDYYRFHATRPGDH